MNTFERIKKLIKDIKPELNTEKIHIKDSFQNDLGFDFSDFSKLYIAAEDEFNLPDMKNLTLRTVEDMCCYIDDVRCGI